MHWREGFRRIVVAVVTVYWGAAVTSLALGYPERLAVAKAEVELLDMAEAAASAPKFDPYKPYAVVEPPPWAEYQRPVAPLEAHLLALKRTGLQLLGWAGLFGAMAATYLGGRWVVRGFLQGPAGRADKADAPLSKGGA